MRPAPLLLATLLLAGCRSAPSTAPDRRELFPGVAASLSQRWVEFEGTVPINAHDPVTPRVYLELMVCTPDTKEHESLVMTRALPSHVHAALLAIGLEPGSPGTFRQEDTRIIPVEASGPTVRISVRQGQSPWQPLESWIINAETRERFTAQWVFAGSRIRTRQGRERYDADGMGTLIGLTSFGAEVIAPRQTISPDSFVAEPVWIADTARTPKFGTPVTVRIEAIR